MNLIWPALGALGLFLFVSGLPLFTRTTLRQRIDPYAGGLPRGSVRPRPHRSDVTIWQRVPGKVAARLPADPRLTQRLAASGSHLSLDAFRLEQIIWGFVAALSTTVAAASLQATKGGVDLRVLPVLGIILFGAGYLGRDWWLSQQIERRYARLRDELPAAIDLITLSMMAGESVAAACARVAQVMPGGIGEEFERVNADVRAGAPIVEALEGLAARVPEVGVGRFVDALCVGIEKGAPLADTLRAQADDSREARRRMLLEIGGKREVLMLIPVVFLIMPVVVVFALYPGLVTLDLLVP